MSSTPGSRSLRTVVFVGLSALFFGLIAPISPAAAAEEFTTLPQASIDIREPTVGDVLTAVLDTPAVPAADTYSYQWYTYNPSSFVSAPIPGATDQKHTVTESDVGYRIEVVVVAHKAGYSDEEDIAWMTGVVKRIFTSGPEVSIDDTTPDVGQTVSAVLEKDSVPAKSYGDYRWYADDGVHEPSWIGSGPTHIVNGGDVGHQLKVRVTAYDTYYYDAYGWSAGTAVIEKGDFTAAPIPTITDTTPTTGQALSASITPSSPAADSYARQWNADGVAVTGETDYTFTPTAAQIGKLITVSVKAIKYGYNDGVEVTSAPTEAVSAAPAPVVGFSQSSAATLSTTAPKVGTVLKVTPTGPSSPTPDSYSYEWQKISPLGVRTTIVGAIGNQYAVPFSDLAYRIRVRLTSHKAGYEPIASPSVWTARVNQILLDKTSVTRGQSLKVTGKRLRVGQLYRIFIDGKTVYKGNVSSTGTAVRTVTVPTSIPKGTKRVWVSGYTSSGVRDFQVVTTVVIK